MQKEILSEKLKLQADLTNLKKEKETLHERIYSDFETDITLIRKYNEICHKIAYLKPRIKFFGKKRPNVKALEKEYVTNFLYL